VTLTLQLRAEPPAPVDASVLTADVSARDVLRCGRERLQVGDLFTVTGSVGDGLILDGDLRRFDGIGRGLADGEVVVHGDVGDWAGADMSGGLLAIHGSAGNRLGAAAPGARTGMRGGEIVVTGDAGEEAGAGLRRGLVAIGGRAGPGAGLRMLAGTVIALGGFVAEAGMGNRRGSLVSGASLTPLPTYTFAARLRLPALGLQLRRVRALGLPVADELLAARWSRWSGDGLELNRGEMLIYDGESELSLASSLREHRGGEAA
jgi:formylmethanofuran dehydrogenase subunit C